MIFKEEDCVDLAKNKKAIQSSISNLSHIDDASRACKDDLIFDDFAFHTGLEENPWWMVDLEQIEAIDCVRITNRVNVKYQDRIKNIKVELSLDGNIYIKVDPSMFEWNGLDSLDVNIYQAAKARYIRISFHSTTYMALKKVEVFVRRIPGIIMCGRGDGFGSRILNFIYVKYLSEKTQLKFGFIWPYRDEKRENTTFVDSKDVIFSKEYLKKYHYDLKQIYSTDIFRNTKYIADIANNKYHKYPWGGFFTNVFLGKSHFADFDFEDYKKSFSRIFYDIDFSSEYVEIINNAKKIFSKSFIALHVRCGDVIFDDRQTMRYFQCFRQQNAPTQRIFPLQIVLEIIKKFQDCSIVLFSDNSELCFKIKSYLGYKNLYIADEISKTYFGENCPKNIAMEKTIFDLILMSQAQKIFAPIESTYSILASYIGENCEHIPFQTFFSYEEQYRIIWNNFDIVKQIYPQYLFASLAYLFSISLNLNLSQKEQIKILETCYEVDSKGISSLLALFRVYFLANEADKVEQFLEKIDKNSFIKTLLYQQAQNYHNKQYFNDYFANASKNFPYISYVALKIYQEQKLDHKAKEIFASCIYPNFKKDSLFEELNKGYSVNSSCNNYDFIADKLIDVAKNKKATQSSVSQFSKFDDASRACRDDLIIDDYAFHTQEENNPWWMIDLEEEYQIESIVITNRIKYCKERAKTLKILYFSKEKSSWNELQASWDSEFGILKTDIHNEITTRFIKLILNECTSLHLAKVQVFSKGKS